ncbi:MAG TPA: DUF4962 domain-containing protein [Armatimonadetes bacterium]|nr:DUF4962 domain-containing protein [Armatimonadota bacterium]
MVGGLMCGIGGTALAGGQEKASPVHIDAHALLPDNPRSHYSRFVNFRPADGEVVHLNPPRFSWRYAPHAWEGGLHTFTFQIAAKPDLREPVVSVTTPYNFYNTLPVLRGAKRWYWRVGYDVGTPQETWSKVRSFTLAPEAGEWDRSALANPNLAARGHPRILFNRENLPAIRRLKETHPACRAAAEEMRRQADAALQTEWWRNFPSHDREPAPEPFLRLAQKLVVVAFAWQLYQDPKYAGVKERAVTLASYPKGGRASPEGAGGESAEDSTQITEFLALLFDWLYPVLSEEERRIFIHSLEWRIDHFINNFAWKRRGVVRSSSLSTQCSSHGFEGSMDTAPAGLALYEHSPLGKECFDLMLNYLIGVTNGFGFDEAWNEGPGYGNSKMKWLLNATLYYDTALPEAHLGRNPYYRAIGDFFCRVTPVGLPHSPWGNGSAREGYYRGNRLANFRKLAFLTGEGRFLRNWRESGGKVYASWRPWIEYVLPYYYEEPEETLEEDSVKVFPIAGWVTASSHPPSSRAAFKEAVGIVFQARPRGGYSHSFHSDNSFQIHAYGQQINHGGGSTANKDAYAYHTMSHTTLLVDGLGQAQPSGAPLYPTYARVVAFQRGEGYVYFAGDATRAYPRQPGNYRRWGLPLGEVYQKRALGYLRRFLRHVLFLRNRYFIIFDDLETSPDQPATFTWLYHILPEEPFQFDPGTFTVNYAVNDVQVKLVHLAQRDQLLLDDRRGLEGMVNPFTGEDYRKWRKEGPLCAHNLWISNRRPASQFHFLAVIYPYRSSGPEPVITRVDDWTVRVEWGTEVSDLIHFGTQPPPGATFVVDYRSIGLSCGRAFSSQKSRATSYWLRVSGYSQLTTNLKADR